MSAAPISVADLQKALADFKDPETGLAAAGQKQIRDVEVSGNGAALTLALSTHSAAIREETKQRLIDFLRARLPGLADVKVELAVHERPPQKLGQVGLTSKSVIAVGSGKGGVGKSTIAASLALGLLKAGSKVGLLDTDVYGPSIPHLLGLTGAPQPTVVDGKVPPVMAGPMPVMSMGFLLPPGKAVIWRGPMLHSYVTQFLRDVNWGDLDYLIIDMPPGTGDIALSLSQVLPLTGAVIVCTPQPVALIDAERAISMFRTVNIPILGMVENMSGFICEGCGKRYDIFGSGGARQKAEELNVPFLGEVPLNISIRTSGDAGRTAANFSDPIVAPYLEKMVAALVRNLATTAAAKPPMMQLPVLK
ncbi:MAG TPA: Mrp/NBP35 family ATP-binding protein [Pirellulaceae bacterium]|nr:Mrp/NBP35 family ATP-binding protein [Pirellulaceae bacterium]